jgi:FkbM family methyltransferase
MKNYIKKTFFTNTLFENFLIILCRLHYFFSKLFPSNTHYPKYTYRTVSRNGIKYHLDISDYQEYLIYFDLKEDSSEPFLEYAPLKEGVFIDIGANIGQTSMNLSKKLGKIAHKIYAFEPIPSTYEKLKYNILLNNFSSIEIFNIALGNEEDIMKMEMSCPTNSGGFKMTPKNSIIENEWVQVLQKKLDDFYKLDNPIQFIKIDVEGYEIEVLKGAEQIIKKYTPVMVIELNDLNQKRQNSSAKELVSYVKELGYKNIINLKTMEVIDFPKLDNCSMDILCKLS